MKTLNLLPIAMLLSLTSCHAQPQPKHSWIQQEESGPTPEHSYSVIKNEQSHAYIGIVKKQDSLRSVVVKSPETLVTMQYDPAQHLDYIKLTENDMVDNQPRTRVFIIKKINGEWKMENASQ